MTACTKVIVPCRWCLLTVSVTQAQDFPGLHFYPVSARKRHRFFKSVLTVQQICPCPLPPPCYIFSNSYQNSYTTVSLLQWNLEQAANVDICDSFQTRKGILTQGNLSLEHSAKHTYLTTKKEEKFWSCCNGPSTKAWFSQWASREPRAQLMWLLGMTFITKLVYMEEKKGKFIIIFFTDKE